jgi:alpha-beta hydrolase superfamily lysophospholipase
MDPQPAKGCSPQRVVGPTRRRRGAWRVFRWSVRIGVVLAMVGGMLYGCNGLFYYPSDRQWYSPSEFRLAHEDVWFKTSDGVTLHGWWLPAEGAAKGTVIHFHGNAENVSGHVVLVEWLPRDGYNVLMFDYRGYGRSGGRVTREGTIRDGHAAVDYALTRPEVDWARLFAYGQSLGGAVAVVVAAERPEIRSLVVESSFSGYRRIAAQKVRELVGAGWIANGLASALISSGHDPIDVVHKIAPRPLLIISGECDAICSAELNRELYDAAGEPKEYWLVPGGQHLGIMEAEPQALRARVLACFERAGSR